MLFTPERAILESELENLRDLIEELKKNTEENNSNYKFLKKIQKEYNELKKKLEEGEER